MTPIDAASRLGFHGGMKQSLAVALAWGWAVTMAVGFAAPAGAGTLEDIRGRGVVTCAVPANAPGIAEKKNGQRSGLAIDLCAALAAAVTGHATNVAFVDVADNDGIVSLQAGEADVLFTPARWSFAQEVNDGVLLLEPLLKRESDGNVFGPMLRQGDDAWFVTLRWLLEALRKDPKSLPSEAAEQGVTQLGLAAGWTDRVAAASKTYDQLLQSHMSALQGAGWSVVPAPEGMRFGP